MSDGPQAPERPPLDSEPDDRSLIRPWHLAVAGILISYPLSVGPVAWMCRWLDPMQQHTGFVQVIYFPIKLLFDRLPLVRTFYKWYFRLFGL